MTIGVDLCYDTGTLRGGAGTATATADAAARLAGRVPGVVIDPSAFGDVEWAGPVAEALIVARDAIATLADRVRQVHAELARQAGAAAGTGDQLIADTTATARLPMGGGR